MDFFENHDRWEWLSYEAKSIRLQIRTGKDIEEVLSFKDYVLSSGVGGVDSEARTVGGRWEALCETSGESQGASVELYQ